MLGERSDFKQEAAVVARRVANLRKRLEEWGSVTVSAPLVMKEAGEFNLGDEPTYPNALQYINLALTSAQGGVSQSTATAFSNQLDMTVTPTVSINPLTGAKVARPNTDSSLTPDTVANGTSITLTNSLAPGTAGGTAGTFAPPGGLVVGPNGQTGVLKPGATGTTLTPNSSFTLSGSQAALIGVNAKLTEKLMRTMADPPQQLFTNPVYQIHFAIVQVSCNPGWRTRENYIADVSATCQYFRANKIHDEFGNLVKNPGGEVVEVAGRAPRVFSVLPLLDAQTLELQNSERRLTELAGSLSAAFPTAAANLKGRDLMQFVKQFQKDTQTVTPRTVANSYSSGSTFGFRLTPSLTALKDPARSGSKPANILQATSFPVLVTVVISLQDITDLQANAVKVSIANRWLINDRPPFKEVWRRIGLPLWRERTGARIDMAMEWGEANQELGYLLDYSKDHSQYQEAAATLERDLQELRSKLVGVDNPVFCLPAQACERRSSGVASTQSPVIQQVVPNTLAPKGDVSIFISGLNFFAESKSTTTKQDSKGNMVPVVSTTHFDAKTPFLFSSNSDTAPNIDVWLGQIKGTVLMCNGDDQLVVKFQGLDSLSGATSAPLVIRTNYGASAIGSAVTITAATGTAAASTAPTVSGTPDETDTKANSGAYDFVTVLKGKTLDGVKGAKLLNSLIADFKDVKMTSLLRQDGTMLVLSWTKLPEDALGKSAILELDDNTDATAKSLLQFPITLPQKSSSDDTGVALKLPPPITTDPVANKSAFDLTAILSGAGLEKTATAILLDPSTKDTATAPNTPNKDGKPIITTPSAVTFSRGGNLLIVPFTGIPAASLGQKAAIQVLDAAGNRLGLSDTFTLPSKP